MNSSIFFDAPLSDQDRRNRLYAGDIFVLAETPASRELIALARDLLEEAFAPHDPRSIHEHKTAEEVAEILSKLKPQFIHHPTCKILLPRILAENGCDLDKTYFDVPRMRSAYPPHFLRSGIAYAFHPHRDTWYSAPMCQLNWWMPIYPLEPDNAMAFYPRYFSEPVQNNSEIFNYYEWNTRNRATAAQHVKTDTREQPRPQQDLDRVTVRLLPPPGAIILFSGRSCMRPSRTRPESLATALISVPSITTMSCPGAAHPTWIHAAPGRPCEIICGALIFRTFLTMW